MAKIYNEKMMADIDGDFVVFLIGMRINKLWKVHKWFPVFLAMGKMLKELYSKPDSGFMGHIQGFPVIVQYWRTFEQLEAFARAKDQTHWPAWINFYKKVGMTNGDVGIWHETYKVQAGQYEAIYGSMPAFGLGKFSNLLPAKGRRDSARGRMEVKAEELAAKN